MTSKKILLLSGGTLLLVSSLFFYFSHILEEPITPISDTQNTTTVTSSTPRIITYSNPEYRLSLEYPCISFCDIYAQQPQPNQLGGGRISIPVSERSYFSLDDFTDEGIAEWNSQDDFGPGAPFKYSINSLREKLALPTGSKCKIHSLDDKETFDCIITLFDKQKAVQFTGIASHSNYPIRHSYINIENTNKWLSIVEFYPDTFDPIFLTDTSNITKEEQQEISAMKAVIDTIKFY